MSLEQWQDKIYENFKLLHSFRMETPHKNPVFALEHSLSTSEIDSLKADIRAHIAIREPSDSHWLPWIVYAAEIGYIYDGHEYWNTFESSTLGWTRFSDRNRKWIRECFLRFRDEFNGAEPSGPWAEWFKNICWPIRHAILPHYLQHQLAKALFDMRLFFRGELFESPLILGNFIATHCRTGTKRFRELLEDPILVGQFSIALLLQGHKVSEDLLLKETQIRIVADLGKEKMEREWLESAQRQAVTTYEGLRRNAATGRFPIPRGRATSMVKERLRIENTPRLLLYPKANGKEWGVKIELQDLRSLTECFRDLEATIAGNYSIVAGTSGSPLPRGMFLRPGPHAFALNRWPSDTEILIRFENAPPLLDSFMSMDQLVHAGDTYLFKISTENIGYEIFNKHLRPSQKYVLVSKLPIRHDGAILKPFDLQCEGVYSALIETPSEITSHFECIVKNFGLSCAKSLHAWPVGMPAKEWDDEGSGVWLVGDAVRIAVRADYELSRIELTINHEDPSYFDVSESCGSPVLFDLSFLPLGKNLIEIKAIAKHKSCEDLVGYLSAIVREPKVWDIKTANQGALKGFIDPETPSMEEIWENDVNIEIFGPYGRTVECTCRLIDMTGTNVIREKQITGLKMPVYSESWRNIFNTQVRQDESLREAYDVAHISELFFDAEEMGSFKVIGERKSTPIRWAVYKSGRHKKLRYINETEAEIVDISRFEFTAPDVPIEIEQIGLERTVDYIDGGLFLIQGQDEITDSIIMLSSGEKLTLQNIRIFPQLQKIYEGGEGVLRLIALYDLWQRSRTSGNVLSDLLRSKVLRVITSSLCSIIGGSHWKEAESAYLLKEDETNFVKLKNYIADKPDERYIGAVLYREAERLAHLTIDKRKNELERLFLTQIKSLSRKYSIAHVGKDGIIIRRSSAYMLPEFVLRLSSAPNTVLAWGDEMVQTLCRYLHEVPAIAKAGRFLVLAVERHLAKKQLNAGDSCYKGWNW